MTDRMFLIGVHLLINVGSRRFVYNSKTGTIYEVDTLTWEIIKFAENNGGFFDSNKIREQLGYFEEDIQRIREDLISSELISFSPDIERFGMKQIHLTGIELLINQKCNMSCDYCYAGRGEYNNPGEMTWTTVRNSIQFLINHTRSKKITIGFMGGEPLLSFPLIIQTVDFCERLAISSGHLFRYCITTNGTLLNPEKIEFFSKNHFAINISMDNDKATHDLHRKFKNGCGTYEQVIKGLKSILLLSPTIRSTVTPYLLNIRKPLISSVPFFIDFTYELFLQKNLIPQIKQLLFQMLGIFCDDLYKGCYVVRKENLTVYQVIKRYAFFHNRQFFCDSMLHGIAVDKDGLFYPCHRFCTNRSFNIGNIHSGLDEKRVIDFLSVISIQNNDTCNVCWAQNICGGFCPYVNFSLFGNYQKRNYELCGVFKDFYQEVLKLFLSLTDQEKIALGLTHNIKT